MSCLAVVLHHLACPAAAELVELEEDYITGAGDADAVFLDQFVDRRRRSGQSGQLIEKLFGLSKHLGVHTVYSVFAVLAQGRGHGLDACGNQAGLQLDLWRVCTDHIARKRRT